MTTWFDSGKNVKYGIFKLNLTKTKTWFGNDFTLSALPFSSILENFGQFYIWVTANVITMNNSHPCNKFLALICLKKIPFLPVPLLLVLPMILCRKDDVVAAVLL